MLGDVFGNTRSVGATERCAVKSVGALERCHEPRASRAPRGESRKMESAASLGQVTAEATGGRGQPGSWLW